MIDNTEARMGKVMSDFGFFRSTVKCDSTANDKKVKLKCSILAGPRYTIGKITYPYDTLSISKDIKQLYPLKYLKEGEYYHQQNVVKDRAGIISSAKNNGYIYFDARDLVFYIDTLKQNSVADIFVEIRNENDSISQKKYVLGDIKVDSKYVLNQEDSQDFVYDEDTGIFFNKKHQFVDEEFIERMLVQKTGEVVSEKKQKISSNRLLNLGIFKFVRNEMSIGQNDTLNQTFLLTPNVTKTITGELELNNRTGNFFGTSGSVSYVNKNRFRGGERFRVGLSGGIETQFGEKSFINTRQLKLSTSLEFPRLIIPFKPRASKYFVPWTIVSASINSQRRIKYFDISDFELRFGYRWQDNQNKFHEFYPIDINSFYISNITSTFKKRLEAPENIRLRESFEDKVVLALRYAFIYNNTADAGPRDSWYFKTEFTSAGNMYSLVEKAFPSLKSNISNRISQFVKVTADLRKYWSMGDSDIATRFYLGAGYAYGISGHMPYSEQFSIGGSNSLRAFALRTVGPGMYVNDGEIDNQYIDQTGDVKLEMNIEYRFPVAGFVKGALFLDSGNVWLLDRGLGEGQRFVFNEFYKNISLGTGLGVRFDFNFFVFRLDMGIPLRGPINKKFQWLDKFDIVSKTWRRDYLKWNLGIGYPF